MKNGLIEKIKGMSKKTLCGILSLAVVLSSVSVGLIISASGNYIAMPSLSDFHVMPLSMSEDGNLYSKFDNSARYTYPKPHDQIFESGSRKAGAEGIGAVTLSRRGGSIGGAIRYSGTGNIWPVLFNGGPNYGLLDQTQLQNKMLGYGRERTLSLIHI